jgi:peptidyl-prolyl cis-trans isomerase D
LQKNSYYVNDISEGRQIVRWAFEEAKDTGEVAKRIFDQNDRFVIALLNKSTKEGPAKLDDVRESVVAEVRKQLKGDQILAKVQGGKTLDELKNKYGTGAVVGQATDVTLQSVSLPDLGYDPVAAGKLFGLKPNVVSAPFKGESGVAALQLETLTPAPKIADYTQYKTQLIQRRSGPITYYLTEAVKEVIKVKDDRIKFQ